MKKSSFEMDYRYDWDEAANQNINGQKEEISGEKINKA